MTTTRLPVATTDPAPATTTGWCALNSSHVYRPGDRTWRATLAGRALGRVCDACGTPARRENR